MRTGFLLLSLSFSLSAITGHYPHLDPSQQAIMYKIQTISAKGSLDEKCMVSNDCPPLQAVINSPA